MDKQHRTKGGAVSQKKKDKAKIRKTSRKKGGNEKILPIIEKVIAIVLAAALVFGVCAFVVKETGAIERLMPVAKVGDYKVPMTLYNYAYRQAYLNIFNTYAQYYASLGSSAGFDIYNTPTDQEYIASDEQLAEYPEAAAWKNWADVIETQTLLNLQRTFALYYTALETEGTVESSTEVTLPIETNSDGTTDPSATAATSIQTILSPYNSLTDAEKAEIDAEIEEIRLSYAESSMSVNAGLANMYGKGFTEKVLREQMALDIITERFETGKTAEYKAKYTDEKCTELFKADPVNYAVLDYRIFTYVPELPTQNEGEKDTDFAKRLETAKAKAKETAEGILKKINSEDSFIAQAEIQGKAQNASTESYEFDETTTLKERTSGSALNAITEKTSDEVSATENFRSDAASWAFSSARKSGDVAVYYSNDSTANFVYILRPAYAFVPVTVREVVVAPQSSSASDDSTTTTYTDAEIATAKTKAENVLKTWKDGKKTAESFGELAVSNSSGTTASDGGVQSITSSATQSADYLAWALDPARKAGDTTVLQIDNTFYVLYFEKKDKAEYFDTIATAKSAEDYAAFEDELLAKDEFKLVIKKSWAAWATKVNEKWIKKTAMPYYLQQYEASASSTDLSSLLGG